MNKIKVLYDVFKTLQAKEVFNGELKLKAEKDGASVLDLAKEFEFDHAKGQGKIKISVESDCCGNKAKHEGSAQFDLNENCCGHQHLKRIHEYHMNTNCCGVKGHLERITFILGLLNKIEVKENGEGALLSLDLKGFCQEACTAHAQGACCEGKFEGCCGCQCFKDFVNYDYASAVLTVAVNKNREIEKVELEAKGSDRNVKSELILK